MNLTNEKNINTPTFSVVIPAYNSQDFLEKGVNSVLNQTCDDLELVLVDDGSKDKTLELCNKFAKKDKRVKVIHQRNGGHTSARNTGLVNSTGKYVVFLDSDDWLDTDALEIFKKDIEKNNPDIIIFSVCQSVNDDNSALSNLVTDGFYKLKEDKRITENLIMSPSGDYTFPKSLSGKVFKREKVINYQLNIPKDVLVGEDGACFVFAVLSSETVSVILNKYYRCSVREDSVSRSCDKLAFSRYISLIDFYKDNLDLSNEQLLGQLQRYIVSHLYSALQFVMRSDCSKKYVRKEYKKVVSDDFIKNAIKKAKFNKIGKKMRVKQFILRYKLFFLVKPLSILTHWLVGGPNFAGNYRCKRYSGNIVRCSKIF